MKGVQSHSSVQRSYVARDDKEDSLYKVEVVA